ncbi:MAG: GPI ethanolamine phosphate transferase [Amphiamblys sp. WSBS2006]|nr:MAG: GPI ethanolamine phosphate transferase [Amphiamblys sp. WSBS2006]
MFSLALLSVLSLCTMLVGIYPLPRERKAKNISARKTTPLFPHGEDQLAYHPWFGGGKRRKKAVFLIIDGLRFDCLVEKKKDIRLYHNKLGFLNSLFRTKDAKLFKAIAADSSTVTYMKMFALFSGMIPNITDIFSSFSAKKKDIDNIFHHILLRARRFMFTGDDTTPKMFDCITDPKSIGSECSVDMETAYSFDLQDYYRYDSVIDRKIQEETARADWEYIFAHSFCLDHLSHAVGMADPAFAEKLAWTDRWMQSLFESLEDGVDLFLLSDHGMTDSGGHGGLGTKEVMSFFLHIKKGAHEKILPENKPHLAEWNDFFARAEKNRKEAFAGTEIDIEWPYAAGDFTGTIYQSDITSTFSVMHDIPIPTENIGFVVAELIVDFSYLSQKTDLEKERMKQLRVLVDVARMNFYQILDHLLDMVKTAKTAREMELFFSQQRLETKEELEDAFLFAQERSIDLLQLLRRTVTKKSYTKIALGTAGIFFLFGRSLLRLSITRESAPVLFLLAADISTCFLENEDHVMAVGMQLCTIFLGIENIRRSDSKQEAVSVGAKCAFLHFVIWLCGRSGVDNDINMYISRNASNVSPFSTLGLVFILLNMALSLRSTMSFCFGVASSLWYVFSYQQWNGPAVAVMALCFLFNFLAWKKHPGNKMWVARLLFLFQHCHNGILFLVFAKTLLLVEDLFDSPETNSLAVPLSVLIPGFLFFKTGHQMNIQTIPWIVCCMCGNVSHILSVAIMFLNLLGPHIFSALFARKVLRKENRLQFERFFSLYHLSSAVLVFYREPRIFGLTYIQRAGFLQILFLAYACLFLSFEF